MNTRILCVEDDPGMCELVSHILSDYQLTCASTVMNARRMAAAEKFDLIILDYILPDGTGAGLCTEIRSFDIRTPILFVTSHSDFTETEARRLGANGTLHKHNPLFISELTERVRELALTRSKAASHQNSEQ